MVFRKIDYTTDKSSEQHSSRTMHMFYIHTYCDHIIVRMQKCLTTQVAICRSPNHRIPQEKARLCIAPSCLYRQLLTWEDGSWLLLPIWCFPVAEWKRYSHLTYWSQAACSLSIIFLVASLACAKCDIKQGCNSNFASRCLTIVMLVGMWFYWFMMPHSQMTNISNKVWHEESGSMILFACSLLLGYTASTSVEPLMLQQYRWDNSDKNFRAEKEHVFWCYYSRKHIICLCPMRLLIPNTPAGLKLLTLYEECLMIHFDTSTIWKDSKCMQYDSLRSLMEETINVKVGLIDVLKTTLSRPRVEGKLED